MLKINFRPETKKIMLIITRDLFLVFYFLAMAFSALEAVKPRLVTNYISLDLFFLLLLAFGLITIAYYPAEECGVGKLKFLDYLTVLLFSVAAGTFTVYLTRQLGWLALLVGLVSSVIYYYFIISCCEE